MAKVEIDISEFDALRDQNNERAERIKKLEEELQGANNGTRTLIRNTTIVPNINLNNMYNYIRNIGDCVGGSYLRSDLGVLSEIAANYLKFELSQGNTHVSSESQQFVNFDDIINQVRESTELEVKNSLKVREQQLDVLSKKYSQTELEVYERCKKEFDVELDSIQESNKRELNTKDDTIKNLEKINAELQSKVSALTNTIAKYNKLNWFQRIFTKLKSNSHE